MWCPRSAIPPCWKVDTRSPRWTCTEASSGRLRKDMKHALEPELDGISVTRVLLEGDPAQEIVQAARDRNVDLVMMSTHGHGAFYRFLLGSVAAKVLHESPCPVWTGVHLDEASPREFSI